MKIGDFLSKDEKEKQNKDKFGKLKKGLSVLVLATSIAALAGTFAGCKEEEKAPNTGSPSTSIDRPITGGEVTPDPIVEPEPVVIPVEKIDEFSNKLKKNFSYSMTENSETTTLLYDGDITQEFRNDDAKGSIYYMYDNSSCVLIYDESDQKWHRYFSINMDAENPIRDFVATDYNPETETFIGTLSGKTVELVISNDTVTVNGQNIHMEIYNVGTTEIVMPEEKSVVEEREGYKTEPVYIWNEEKGYFSNIPAFAKVMEDWIKEHPDELARYNNWHNFQRIVYFTEESDYHGVEIEREGMPVFFGVYYDEDDEMRLGGFRFRDPYISLFQENKIKTTDDLINMLESERADPSRNYSIIVYDASNKGMGFRSEERLFGEYSSLDWTEEQKEVSEAVAEKVLQRISTVGVQPYDVYDKGINPVPEFANAEVLFIYKGPDNGIRLGESYGYGAGWMEYYILKHDDKLELVGFQLSAAGLKNQQQTIIKNKSGTWLITNLDRREININNVDYLKSLMEKTKEDNTATQSTSTKENTETTTTKQILYYKGKEKDLEL